MFYVSYDEGEIYDSYDEYVTGGLNTYFRIIDEYNDYVDEMFLNEYGNEVELCYMIYIVIRVKMMA